MSSVMIEDYLPVVKYQGLNTAKSVDLTAGDLAVDAGSVTITVGSVTVTAGDINLGANNAKVKWTGTGSNGGILYNPKWAAATATSLASLTKSIEVSLGGTAYYIPAYATAN